MREEYRGLDLVRRDWAKLSSNLGKEIVNWLLYSDDVEKAKTDILARLKQVNEEIKADIIPKKLYCITKKLMKNPKEYKDDISHVQCAKKMLKSNLIVKVGDFIQYIICEGEGDVCNRAWPFQLVEQKKLRIDREWYCRVQLLPPILRLVESIKEFKNYEIGNCFEIEIKKSLFEKKESNYMFSEVYFQRNKNLEKGKMFMKLKLKCKYCLKWLDFTGIIHTHEFKAGFKCLTRNCPGFVNLLRDQTDIVFYKNQLTRRFRSLVSKYYKHCSYKTYQDQIVTLFKSKYRKVIDLGYYSGEKIKESFSSAQLNFYLEQLIYLFDIKKVDQQMMYKQLNLNNSKERVKKVEEIYLDEKLKSTWLEELHYHCRHLKNSST